jgi:general secretion pathway protein I
MLLRRSSQRPGLSLLEVLLAMTILWIGVVGLYQLMNLSTDTAMKTQDLNIATELLQHTMNRVISGDISVQGTGNQAMDDDHKNWSYSVQSQADSVTGLYHVTVTVTHNSDNGKEIGSWSMNEYVMDPAVRWTLNSTTPSSPPPSLNGGSSGSGGSGSGTGSSGP